MTVRVSTIRAAVAGRTPSPAQKGPEDRFAAVAAIFRDRAEGAEVLLIRRAAHPGDPWSGQMALPGGRHDPSDPDLLHTAIRETEEEVGLRLDARTHLLGRLDDLPAMARGRRVGLIIAPHVFVVEGEPILTPCDREVDEVLWAPVSPLVRGERDTTYAWEGDGTRLRLPGYDVDGRIVWGLTHRMLSSLFSLLDVPSASGYALP